MKKIQQIDKYFVRLTKKKNNIQITKIRNERGDITDDLTKIKRIIKEYYEKFYASKIHDVDENGQIPSKTQTTEIDSRRNRKSI